MRYTLIGSGLALAAILVAGSAFAQNANVLGTVERGNTTIVFESANHNDIPVKEYQAWERFAQENPAIVNQLKRNPDLIKNHGWMMSHRALHEFFAHNPKAYAAMRQDPGNFFVPSRSARRS